MPGINFSINFLLHQKLKKAF